MNTFRRLPVLVAALAAFSIVGSGIGLAQDEVSAPAEVIVLSNSSPQVLARHSGRGFRVVCGLKH